MNELAQSGRLSILNFYERRARRLLPALLLVMLASLLPAWHFLLPEQLLDFSKSLVFSLFFSSNFYWHFSLQEYGAESALLKPFLHTWSLGVEEQYYIVFPLLLFSIYKWARQYIAVILSISLVLSLLFAQSMTGRDTSFSFYMMPARFWELLAGSLVALFLLRPTSIAPQSLWYKIMPSFGLFLIGISLLFSGLNAHHPGLINLIPVVGTVLIIGSRAEGLLGVVVLFAISLALPHFCLRANGKFAAIADHKVCLDCAIATFFCNVLSSCGEAHQG
jgi:peptidoglycan/LPS O-acetylase OafA/YrhL